MAARKTIWTPEIVRQRIQTSQLANRLTSHALGGCEMSATQVSAALGLLRKTMPDLSAMAHSGALEVKRAEELTDSELAAIATGSSARAADAQDSPQVTDEIH